MNFNFNKMSNPFEKTKLSEKISEKINFSKSEIERLSLLGITLEDLKKLFKSETRQGHNAFVFSMEEKNIIAKKNKKMQNSISPEYAVLRVLQINDFKHTPAPIFFVRSEEILFEEQIDGHSVDLNNSDNIEKLAVVLANLHSIEFEKYGKPFSQRKRGNKWDNLLYNFDLLESVWKKLFKEIPKEEQLVDMSFFLEYLAQFKDNAERNKNNFQGDKFSLIHFDLHPENIIERDDESIVLVDWGNASIGDNAMDIAKLFLKCNFNNDQEKSFFDNYSFKDDDLQARVKIYMPLVILNSIAWRLSVLHEGDCDNNKIINGLRHDVEIFNKKI